MLALFFFLRWILNPRTWLQWPWQQARGIAWPVAFILALGYSPGHPWSGLEALGICVGIVLVIRVASAGLRGTSEGAVERRTPPEGLGNKKAPR